jgi:hypothetical protein
MIAVGVGLISVTAAKAQNIATDAPVGKLEIIATFTGPMPTGVTVADDGRKFVNFPKWGDAVV